MKWHNHKLITFTAVFALTGGLLPSLGTMAGSVLPDVLELKGIIPHRTYTHYVWFWFLAELSVRPLLVWSGISLLWANLCFFIAVGGIMHVCEDFLSIGGVPLVSPTGKRVGGGLYRTGTLTETLVVLFLAAIFFAVAFRRGFLDFGYMSWQGRQFVSAFGR